MIRRQNQQQGFIALFFILGISFTFVTWISLSSERVFEYVRIRARFIEHKEQLHNTVLCADAFVDVFLESRYNLVFSNGAYDFTRSLYFSDEYPCHISDIRTVFIGNSLSQVFFRIDRFSFEYQFKNGFVEHITSFNIF